MNTDHGGCLVCGVVIGGPEKGEDLLCGDCQENGYMKDTGTTATLVRMTEAGPVRADPTPRAEGLREAVEALPFRRMTGEGLANFGTTGDLFVDWDEYEDVVSKAAVLAALAASSTAPGLDVALDNLATHHELERIAGNTHSRPDRCEFVEQARAALAALDKEKP